MTTTTHCIFKYCYQYSNNLLGKNLIVRDMALIGNKLAFRYSYVLGVFHGMSRMKRFPQVALNCQKIMFQGDNPSTDLRGVGFLGLIQPLYFVTTPELLGLSKAIYKLSLSDKQDFPLMVLSINVTRIALHALRDDLLVRYSSNLICDIQQFHILC